MFKLFDAICATLLLAGVFFLTAGCGESGAALSGKAVFVVGKDISLTQVKDFYYTIDASTNPPLFQRYRFTNQNGKYTFYHEKREGNTWPLTEKHITVSGTTALSAEQWAELGRCLRDGKVTKRVEDTSTGKRGPWLFLYWEGDKAVYQEFTFASLGQKKSFEELAARLKKEK